MAIIWDHPKITIKEVQNKLTDDSPINFNTVMTVMNRLTDKGHLQRRKAGRSYQYQATQSKEDFIEKQTKALTDDLIGEFGNVVVNHMLDKLDQGDPDMLQKLESKIKELKKQG